MLTSKMLLLITGAVAIALWIIYLDSHNLIERQLAITLVVTEVPIGVFLHYILQWRQREASPKQTPVQPSHTAQISSSGIQPYLSRRDVPTFEELFGQAKQTVHIVAITSEAPAILQNNATKTFLRRNNTQLRILILKPEQSILEKARQSFGMKGTLKLDERIGASLSELCAMKKELGNEGYRLQIKLNELLPFSSMVIVDPELDEGKILLEPYLYDTDAQSRPSFDISKGTHSEVFEKFWRSYKFAWEKAIEYKCEDSGRSL